MEKNRKIIVGLFIVLVILQMALLGFVADRKINTRIHGEELRMSIEEANDIGIRIVEQAQSNELYNITEMWHNWNWDMTLGDWDNMFRRFIDRAVVSRQGSDGLRITLVFDSEGNCLYAGSGAAQYAESIAPYALADTNVLYPNTIQADGIRWNKTVIPTPTTSTPRIVIFYGFDEMHLLSVSQNQLDVVNYHAEQIQRNDDFLFWATGAMIISMFILGMAISFYLRMVGKR